MMFNKIRGLAITFLAAFAAEKILIKLPRMFWYISVFLIVYTVGKLCLQRGTAYPSGYLEDLFSALRICFGLAVLAWYADLQISLYTGKHGGPAIPAVVLAVVNALSSQNY